MRLGLISDVHANLPALEAVLEDMPEIDRLYHCGDVVGYNPYPGEVLEVFDDLDLISIQGNHDRKISGDVDTFGEEPIPEEYSDDGGGPDDPGEIALRAGRWTRLQLVESELATLESLATELVVADSQVQLVHGAPGDQDARVYPADYGSGMLDAAPVLVHGHTHFQHAERVDKGMIINPGSVGQPRDDDPRAAYALLDTETLDVDLRRVEYPIEDVCERIRETELPSQLCQWLEQGQIVME